MTLGKLFYVSGSWSGWSDVSLRFDFLGIFLGCAPDLKAYLEGRRSYNFKNGPDLSWWWGGSVRDEPGMRGVVHGST